MAFVVIVMYLLVPSNCKKHIDWSNDSQLLIQCSLLGPCLKMLKCYVLEAGSSHIFKKEAPNLLDSLDPAIHRYP